MSQSPLFTGPRIPTFEEENQMLDTISIKNCKLIPGDDWDQMLFARRIEECQHRLKSLLRSISSRTGHFDEGHRTIIIISNRQHEQILITRDGCLVTAPLDQVINETLRLRELTKPTEDAGDTEYAEPFIYGSLNESLCTFEAHVSRIAENIGGVYFTFIITESANEMLYVSQNGKRAYLGNDSQQIRDLVSQAVQARENQLKPVIELVDNNQGLLAKLYNKFCNWFGEKPQT